MLSSGLIGYQYRREPISCVIMMSLCQIELDLTQEGGGALIFLGNIIVSSTISHKQILSFLWIRTHCSNHLIKFSVTRATRWSQITTNQSVIWWHKYKVNGKHFYVYMFICVCIYIYIYIYKQQNSDFVIFLYIKEK